MFRSTYLTSKPGSIQDMFYEIKFHIFTYVTSIITSIVKIKSNFQLILHSYIKNWVSVHTALIIYWIKKTTHQQKVQPRGVRYKCLSSTERCWEKCNLVAEGRTSIGGHTFDLVCRTSSRTPTNRWGTAGAEDSLHEGKPFKMKNVEWETTFKEFSCTTSLSGANGTYLSRKLGRRWRGRWCQVVGAAAVWRLKIQTLRRRQTAGTPWHWSWKTLENEK